MTAINEVIREIETVSSLTTPAGFIACAVRQKAKGQTRCDPNARHIRRR